MTKPDHLHPVLLTLNAGSSSIKFALFTAGGGAPELILSGQIEGLGNTPRLMAKSAGVARPPQALRPGTSHAEALTAVLDFIRHEAPDRAIIAVGHRVVHGGPHFGEPMRIEDAILAELQKLSPLAPLHQPHNLAGIRAASEAFPDVPQIACFDTAFHRRQPFVNDVFAIPRSLYAEGVRRYGFHGLSYEFITSRLGEIAPLHAMGRVIVAHLGSGASMCAIRNGLSIASTMGFSALDGLPMGTRPGQLDPGVLLYLMTEKNMDAGAISDLLYRECGLKGLSELSGDMRDLEASDKPEAKQAIDYFVFRCRREIGGLAAVLEGLDAIVFCGGIGENAPRVRERILASMEWLGVELDRDANRAGAEVISSLRSRTRVFVIRTDEERMIARHTARLIAQDQASTITSTGPAMPAT